MVAAPRTAQEVQCLNPGPDGGGVPEAWWRFRRGWLSASRRAPDRVDAAAQDSTMAKVDSDSARIAGSVVRRAHCLDALA